MFCVASGVCEDSEEDAEERHLEEQTDELAVEANSVEELGDAVVRVLRVATVLLQQCDVSAQHERLSKPVTSQNSSYFPLLK